MHKVLRLDPKAQSILKNEQVRLHQNLKPLLCTDCEKIFASHTSDKGLVSRIYKELSDCNSQKTNNPVRVGLYQRRHMDKYTKGVQQHYRLGILE